MSYNTVIATIIIFASMYSVLSIGLNLQFGYTGLYNFGIVSFFIVSTYATVIVTSPGSETLSYTLGLPFLVAIPVSVIAVSIVAYLMSIPLFELRTDYFALATIAFGELFRFIALNETWLTGGTFGARVKNRPYWEHFTLDTYWIAYAVVSIVFVVILLLLARRLVNSSFGLLLRAIREDETAVRALGKNPHTIKLRSWIIGAAIASIAGVIWVPVVGQVTPRQFIPFITLLTWMGVLVGGKGNLLSGTVGTFVLIIFVRSIQLLPLPQDNVALIPAIQFTLFSVVIILVMRYRPQGIIPEQNLFRFDQT